ncbi:MAG: alcohol dehydrogenase catalytic domain-containing protein [Variovorax sp.]|nr:alcohol dehydrogenase catalytic domain-containing protein [Variovorax sp.]
MKALVYHGSKDVRVESVYSKDPVIQTPDDIIVQVTATAICGSDLHLFRGKVPGFKAGDVLGHEFMGEVVETSTAGGRRRRGGAKRSLGTATGRGRPFHAGRQPA